jgi:hypothetical protein
VQPLRVDGEHLQLPFAADRPDVEDDAGPRPQVAVQERRGAEPQAGALEAQPVEHARSTLLLLAGLRVRRVTRRRFVEPREEGGHLGRVDVPGDAVEHADPAHAQQRRRWGRLALLDERGRRVQQRQRAAQLVPGEREVAGEHEVALRLGARVELVAAVSPPQLVGLVAGGLLGQGDQLRRPPEGHLPGRLDPAVGMDQEGVGEEPVAGRLGLLAPVGVAPVERGPKGPPGAIAQNGLTPVRDVLLEKVLGAAPQLASRLVPLEADGAEAEYGKENRLEQS